MYIYNKIIMTQPMICSSRKNNIMIKLIMKQTKSYYKTFMSVERKEVQEKTSVINTK